MRSLIVVLFALVVGIGQMAEPARAEEKPDCDMMRALGLPPAPGCPAGAPAAKPESGTQRTRGLSIGTGAVPSPPPPTQAPVEPAAATVPAPPPSPPSRSQPASARSAAAAPAAGAVGELTQGINEIKQALEGMRAEQARLADENRQLREMLADTRYREIGRLDGRVDQMTALMERVLRFQAGQTPAAPQGQ